MRRNCWLPTEHASRSRLRPFPTRAGHAAGMSWQGNPPNTKLTRSRHGHPSTLHTAAQVGKGGHRQNLCRVGFAFNCLGVALSEQVVVSKYAFTPPAKRARSFTSPPFARWTGRWHPLVANDARRTLMMRSFKMPESMKLASIWVVWAFLSLAALGWGLQVVISATGSKEGMAAWVQAIGSIFAILVSVWITRQTDRRVERREALIEGKVRVIITELARNNLRWAEALIEVVNEYESPVDWKNILESVGRQVEGLMGFDVKDVPTPEIAKAFLELRGAVVCQRNSIESFFLNGADFITFPLVIKSGAKEVVARSKALLDLL